MRGGREAERERRERSGPGRASVSSAAWMCMGTSLAIVIMRSEFYPPEHVFYVKVNHSGPAFAEAPRRPSADTFYPWHGEKTPGYAARRARAVRVAQQGGRVGPGGRGAARRRARRADKPGAWWIPRSRARRPRAAAIRVARRPEARARAGLLRRSRVAGRPLPGRGRLDRRVHRLPAAARRGARGRARRRLRGARTGAAPGPAGDGAGAHATRARSSRRRFPTRPDLIVGRRLVHRARRRCCPALARRARRESSTCSRSSSRSSSSGAGGSARAGSCAAPRTGWRRSSRRARRPARRPRGAGLRVVRASRARRATARASSGAPRRRGPASETWSRRRARRSPRRRGAGAIVSRARRLAAIRKAAVVHPQPPRRDARRRIEQLREARASSAASSCSRRTTEAARKQADVCIVLGRRRRDAARAARLRGDRRAGLLDQLRPRRLPRDRRPRRDSTRRSSARSTGRFEVLQLPGAGARRRGRRRCFAINEVSFQRRSHLNMAQITLLARRRGDRARVPATG